MATRKYWEAAPADPIFDSRWDAPRQRLTEAGNDYLLTHGQFPPTDVRADALVNGGLKEVITYDRSNRPTSEFELVRGATKRDAWMGQFMATPGLMTAMTNNIDNTRKQHQRYLQAHPDAVSIVL